MPFGRYIGTHGAHMTPEAYEAIGFGRTVVAERIIEDLDFPDEAGVDARLAEQHALFVAVKTQELEGTLADLPAREYNPMRRCTPEDVRAAYRVLLHRDPEFAGGDRPACGGKPLYTRWWRANAVERVS